MNIGCNRRSFLRNAGLSGSVLALGPLAMALESNTSALAAPIADGRYDFETPYNRVGFDDIKWDGATRSECLEHVVAGMGVADMDFKCAPSITTALRRRVQHENWGYLDMLSSGPRSFRQGIIDWNHKRYGITAMTLDNTDITTGVHSGIKACLRAFAPPGSRVLMATPIYSGFYGDIAASKAIANESPMRVVNGRYEIDWNDFERRITPDTKVTILCNPQNPVGRVWTREELTRYGEICLRHNVLVLADEIHCDFITEGHKYTPFCSLDNKAIVNNSITFKSGSKSFSLPAMRCAWYFSTNPDVFNATAFYNHADLSTLGMVAEQAAYAGGEEWLNQCVGYIDANQEYVSQFIKAKMPMLKVGNKPEGSYFQWLDIAAVAEKIGAKKLADDANEMIQRNGPELLVDFSGRRTTEVAPPVTAEDMVQHWFAKHAFVQLNAGTNYGFGGQNYLRMNVATSRKILTAALESMSNALRKISN